MGGDVVRLISLHSGPRRPGWYERGTSPGQPGSAVILGLVTLADGTVETFEVRRLETVRNDAFPAQRVYAGTPRRPTLAIVTCGGDYDADRGGYQSNVIVYAEHVGTSPGS